MIDNFIQKEFGSKISRSFYINECRCRGWFPSVIIQLNYSSNHSKIIEWLKLNCKYGWNILNTCFFEFEKASDALMFKLTWTGETIYEEN